MSSHRNEEDLDYINRLPTEILDLIFQGVAAVSTGASEHTEVDEDISRRAIFPFNVASVCCSWLAILKAKPQFWHHFIIDVVDDPTPFFGHFCIVQPPSGDEKP